MVLLLLKMTFQSGFWWSYDLCAPDGAFRDSDICTQDAGSLLIQVFQCLRYFDFAVNVSYADNASTLCLLSLPAVVSSIFR